MVYLGHFDGSHTHPPRDQAPVLALVNCPRDLPDTKAIMTEFLAATSLWGQSLANPALVAAVVADMAFLTRKTPSLASLLACAGLVSQPGPFA